MLQLQIGCTGNTERAGWRAVEEAGAAEVEGALEVVGAVPSEALGEAAVPSGLWELEQAISASPRVTASTATRVRSSATGGRPGPRDTRRLPPCGWTSG